VKRACYARAISIPWYEPKPESQPATESLCRSSPSKLAAGDPSQRPVSAPSTPSWQTNPPTHTYIHNAETWSPLHGTKLRFAAGGHADASYSRAANTPTKSRGKDYAFHSANLHNTKGAFPLDKDDLTIISTNSNRSSSSSSSSSNASRDGHSSSDEEGAGGATHRSDGVKETNARLADISNEVKKKIEALVLMGKTDLQVGFVVAFGVTLRTKYVASAFGNSCNSPAVQCRDA